MDKTLKTEVVLFSDIGINERFMRLGEDTIFMKILDDDDKAIAIDIETNNVFAIAGKVRKIISED